MTFGSQNGSASSLTHPSGVAVDSDGDVYVTDWGTGGSRSMSRTARRSRHCMVTCVSCPRRASTPWRATRRASSAQPEQRADKVPQQVLQARRHRHRRDDRIFVTDALSRLVVYRKDRDYQEPPL